MQNAQTWVMWEQLHDKGFLDGDTDNHEKVRGPHLTHIPTRLLLEGPQLSSSPVVPDPGWASKSSRECV